MTITVYSKPECAYCEDTKRWLKKMGIAYIERDITQDNPARMIVEASGKTQLPMVDITEDGELVDRWHGFNPHKIRRLAVKAS